MELRRPQKLLADPLLEPMMADLRNGVPFTVRMVKNMSERAAEHLLNQLPDAEDRAAVQRARSTA
ncbi:MAG: hypothetical protein QNI84_13265 [Henriciella sp.]|nr:hypothetical protein [Henriciella sp.]